MDVRKLQQRLEGEDQADKPRPKLPSLFPSFRLPEPDPEVMARIQAGWIERQRAPLVTRDAILALLEETRATERASAKRERWILLFTAATFLVGLAVLLLTVL